MERIVAIHQPNFLPWLGFFHKLATCDVFILLDSVDFSRGSRTNRVQINVRGAKAWLTVPVRRPEHGGHRIHDLRIDDGRPWRRKALRTLEISYGDHPGFAETFALVQPVLQEPTDRLATINEAGILRISEALSLDITGMVRASDLSADGSGSELLAELVDAVGGNVYLSGAGAGDYLVEEPFTRRRIEVRVQRFTHPDYETVSGESHHGLSIVDAMMNIGISETSRLLA